MEWLAKGTCSSCCACPLLLYCASLEESHTRFGGRTRTPPWVHPPQRAASFAVASWRCCVCVCGQGQCWWETAVGALLRERTSYKHVGCVCR